jgi:hypothetical protein
MNLKQKKIFNFFFKILDFFPSKFKLIITAKQSQICYDKYFTHIPILSTMIHKTTGSILELGCGYYSTLLIDSMCDNERLIISVDDNKEWLQNFLFLKRINHKFILIERNNWINKLKRLKRIPWDIIFIDSIDQDESGKYLRARLLNFFKYSSKYIIIHDSEVEFDANHGWRQIINQFKYKYEYRIIKPYTTILSNYHKIPINKIKKIKNL